MNVPDRLTCEEVFARLDDYVDRELSGEEMRLVEEHCALCDVCARDYRFEAGVLAAVRERLRRLAVPADLMRRIEARIANEPK